ncbi:hypothetical protein EHP00_1286 [Ecytonucleospora hepatopenaei]|uniref:Uncharacterized protein n=1 Tax=Ecytonucleospora hepatopenaei TaxID=646526 RepID=A0A1W0E6S6_9MICR|nr:hypothetical protein EHP00_1286 [Ecytonucleospora hepatopenaei]
MVFYYSFINGFIYRNILSILLFNSVFSTVQNISNTNNNLNNNGVTNNITNNILVNSETNITAINIKIDLKEKTIKTNNPLIYLNEIKVDKETYRISKRLSKVIDESNLSKYLYFYIFYHSNMPHINKNTKNIDNFYYTNLFDINEYNNTYAKNIYRCLNFNEKFRLMLNNKFFCIYKDTKYLLSCILNEKETKLNKEIKLEESKITLYDLENMIKININLSDLYANDKHKSLKFNFKETISNKPYLFTLEIYNHNIIKAENNTKNENNLHENKPLNISELKINKENIHVIKKNFYRIKKVTRNKCPPCQLYYISDMAQMVTIKMFIVFIITLATFYILYKIY